MSSGFSLEITNSAALRINELATKQNIKPILRISVEGGGCSGFSYKYEFTDNINENDDCEIQKGEVTIVIDSLSQEFLSGSVLDFTKTLGGSHFSITNPNATAKCGCGNSFSI